MIRSVNRSDILESIPSSIFVHVAPLTSCRTSPPPLRHVVLLNSSSSHIFLKIKFLFLLIRNLNINHKQLIKKCKSNQVARK